MSMICLAKNKYNAGQKIFLVYNFFSLLIVIFGPVAHLVEHLICTEEAAGSSPVWSTFLKRYEIYNWTQKSRYGYHL